ncbi:MAG TPA: hypothetical protein VE964_04015, partial [Myxococcales bacterium]|nr:hypothetical protein [Myxococcales bacterium]
QISTDHGARGMSESDWPVVSPDSRIIADLAPSGSVVESIDGAPPEVIQAPHGQQLGWPNFEPAGGKAIFSRGWLANADGSGVLLHVPGEGYCQWARRTALCQVGHDDPLAIYSFDLVAVTDDGNQIVTLARNAVSWAVSGDSLFYVPNTGGLYVIDGLPRPAP